MNRVLVTGAAGFIGSNFVRYWLETHPEDKVISLDKLTYAGNLENLAGTFGDNHIFIKGDICNPELTDSLMQTVDIVVNFAAETHVDRSILNPNPFIRTNIEGTYNLLESARRANIKRFHHISTDEVYGSLEGTTEGKFTEESPYRPNNPYSASKASADLLVRSYYHTYGLPTSISNCSNNFGPYQHPEKFIPLAITNGLQKKEVPVYGDGTNVRDWIYVEDHCRAINLILSKEETIGQTYLIGVENELSNTQLLSAISNVLVMEEGLMLKTKKIEDRKGHDKRYAIDSSKIKALGFGMSYDFNEAIKKTVRWYINHKSWWLKTKLKDSFKEYYKTKYGFDL